MNKCLHCGRNINESISIYNLFKRPNRLCELCESIWGQVKINHKERRCEKCLKCLSDEEEICLDCEFLATHFKLMEQLYCGYNYNGIMKEIIHQFKFMKDYYLCELLAHLIEIPSTTYDYIVPIPSSASNDQYRTFNPIEAVLTAKGVHFDKILKMVDRPKQASLSKKERLIEENPFIVDTSLDLKDKEILLIDDIYTTGLTIHRAGCKLYTKNIRKFKVFAFAR